MKKQPTYSKQIIEIADYLYKHPDKKVQSVVALFCTELHRSERTIKTYIKNAKEYNATRLKKTEKAKDEVLVSEAKEAVKKAILSREESLQILSSIANGNAKKIPTKVKVEKDAEGKDINIPLEFKLEYPTDNDRTRAIQQLAKMEGWEAPKKIDLNQDVFMVTIADEES